MTDQPAPDQAESPRADADRTGADGTDAGRAAADRAGRRAAHLLPEERAAGGSADPYAQAEVILEESDVREADQRAAPDSFVEHRTSDQAAD
jgi:hypothetical protein